MDGTRKASSTPVDWQELHRVTDYSCLPPDPLKRRPARSCGKNCALGAVYAIAIVVATHLLLQHASPIVQLIAFLVALAFLIYRICILCSQEPPYLDSDSNPGEDLKFTQRASHTCGAPPAAAPASDSPCSAGSAGRRFGDWRASSLRRSPRSGDHYGRSSEHTARTREPTPQPFKGSVSPHSNDSGRAAAALAAAAWRSSSPINSPQSAGHCGRPPRHVGHVRPFTPPPPGSGRRLSSVEVEQRLPQWGQYGDL